jgi:hypothetical protein
MLSAVLLRLNTIRSCTTSSHLELTIELCASSFPDVRPWQVKKVCLSDQDESNKSTGPSASELRDLYYSYLSLILHPRDGHDTARRDRELVKVSMIMRGASFLVSSVYGHSPVLFPLPPQEWCEMSVEGGEVDRKKRKNFLSVASRASSDHLVYERDLVVLLALSAKGHDRTLALDLGKIKAPTTVMGAAFGT